MKRYYVYDFLIGNPILIDTKEKTITYYNSNIYGQIYNLDQEHEKVSKQRISGLIKRLNSRSYNTLDGYVIDRYIYNYIMTEEQRNKCSRSVSLNENDFITSGDNYKEVIEKMCIWVYEYNNKKEDMDEDLRDYYKSYLNKIA